jgi:hypothetical protein
MFVDRDQILSICLELSDELSKHFTVADDHLIYDAENDELDARFIFERDDNLLSVVLENSVAGPSPSNLDYDQALQLILERLASVDAELLRIEVDSKQSASLTREQRTIVLDDSPLLLSAVDNLRALRRRICGGAAKTARLPGATGGGNPRKRLRLFLAFTKRPTPSVEDLVQLIGHDRPIVYDSSLERQSHASELDSERSTVLSWGTRARKQQGFEREQAVREAVEERAMIAAERHYETAQWATTRREHDNVGYDILCIKGSAWLFVKVKGSRRDGSQVIITENEARHAHDNSEHSELFILSEIQVDDIEASGVVRIISKWDPLASGTLVPITYYWQPPLG